MLGKSSVFMMLLIVVASLVGISSMYKPANVETQPQPQPQKPIGPNIIVNPTPLTAQSALENKQFQIQLLDRLMPEIIKRIKVTLIMRDSYSPLAKVEKKGITPDTFHMTEARCPPGTRVMGGGGQVTSSFRAPPSGLFDFNAQDVADNNIAALMIIPTSRVDLVAKMETSGYITAYATCLGPDAVVSLKEVSAASGRDPLAYLQDIRPPSPSQQQPPSQPQPPK